MSEDKLRQVFSKNLKKQLALHDKQPVDLVNDLHIPFSTVSNWVNGAKFPRMGKVELLAGYLGIEKSDLIEEKSNNESTYTYKLSSDELEIIIEYRKLADREKDYIKRMFAYLEKFKEMKGE